MALRHTQAVAHDHPQVAREQGHARTRARLDVRVPLLVWVARATKNPEGEMNYDPPLAATQTSSAAAVTCASGPVNDEDGALSKYVMAPT